MPWAILTCLLRYDNYKIANLPSKSSGHITECVNCLLHLCESSRQALAELVAVLK